MSTLISPQRLQGLSSEEAGQRLRIEGANELLSSRRHGVLAIAWRIVREPMILLLVACGTIYLLLGDTREALLLVASIGVILGIELYQEQKTERALEALRDLSSPRALVIRDGQRIRIPGREVVRGDLIVLAKGDRVSADGVVRSCEHLLVDESLLTGESIPVRKAASVEARTLDRPGGDDLPSVFAGTLVVSGQGVSEVLATGLRTEMGKIGKSLQTITTEQTRVQREIARLVRIFASAGISLCALIAVLYGLSRGSWLQGLLAGLTLAISLVPEELPVILTVFLGLGAWRLSRQQVLTRRVPVVEMLGSATVLCADKTGTLTMNRMSVQEVFAAGALHVVGADDSARLPEAVEQLVAISILASRREPFDPTESALQRLASRVASESLRKEWTLVRECPFSKTLLAVAYIWRASDGQQHVVAVKGAPEAIARLCHLEGTEAEQLMKATSAMASKGLRVLGVASAFVRESRVQDELRALPLQWLGLIGLADPVRPAVPRAIQECREAGVRVVMITGDYPLTAQQIARQISLERTETVITGAELDRMDEAALERRIQSVDLFARIVPEQKLRLVNALKANGEIVAMTGDGVNDAPALKAAHIGIAMGARGTDVAREAAALILLDDDFSSIVYAIRTGRRIFDNLRKAVAYILAIHVPIAGVSLIPVMLRWPLVLLPVHIVFLELIIDPACSIAFEAEPEELDVMRRPPRSPDESMIDRRMVWLSVLQGVSVLIIVLGIFAVTLWRGKSEAEARALTFTSMVISNLALIFTNRSWSRTILETLRKPNAALWWIVAGALIVLGLALYVPVLRDLFGFAVLHPNDLALCLIAGALGVAWFEFLKWRSIHVGRTGKPSSS